MTTFRASARVLSAAAVLMAASTSCGSTGLRMSVTIRAWADYYMPATLAFRISKHMLSSASAWHIACQCHWRLQSNTVEPAGHWHMAAAVRSKHATHRSAALLAGRVDVGVDHGQGVGQALRHDRDVVPDAVALQLVGAEVQRPVLVVDPHLAELHM